MKKKLLSAILAAVSVFAALPVTAQTAAEVVNEIEEEYTLTDGLDEEEFKEAMKPKEPADSYNDGTPFDGSPLSIFDVEPDDSGYYRRD